MKVEIAERKRAEAALHKANDELERKVLERTAELRQSEKELRQLIDAIPQQVFVFDSDWSPLFANRRELEFTGLTHDEVRSKDAVAKIFHPEDLKKREVVLPAPYGLEIIESCVRCSHREERLFCNLPETAVKRLTGITSSATYPKGATLFVEG